MGVFDAAGHHYVAATMPHFDACPALIIAQNLKGAVPLRPFPAACRRTFRP